MTIYESLQQNQQELIRRHLELVIEANEKVNLTRIDTIEEGMLLHIEDSLVGLTELNNAPAGPYGDLGSGGGYPGIPLAIASGRQTTLIDSRQKKMLILDGIIDALGLSDQVETYAGRAELLAKTRSMRYAALTARALAKLPVLMELASPLLKRGGYLICYKAQMDESELAHARRVQKLTGMELLGTRTLTLGKDYTRRIVTLARTGTPTIKLPRQEGQAQKNPL
ncbi:MAG: 16S rRNA (guanine(527)-N(7))-methyltransferase RsmG [Eggerthellaceae bacterium]|nr:16S rRNA (guanine(527)-N(7))-methyltransferase RsmG [Eggerthellaceae bacterium]